MVSPATTYVLTKTVDVLGTDGVERGQSRETISFATGESGKFSKGTICQPNGQLERLVLDSLPANSVVRQPQPRAAGRGERAAGSAAAGASGRPRPVPAAPPPAPAAPPVRLELGEPMEAQVAAATAALTCAAVDAVYGYGNSVRLTGYVSSEQDRARLLQSLARIDGLGAVDTSGLEIAPPPTCELLQVLAPYSGARRRARRPACRSRPPGGRRACARAKI